MGENALKKSNTSVLILPPLLLLSLLLSGIVIENNSSVFADVGDYLNISENVAENTTLNATDQNASGFVDVEQYLNISSEENETLEENETAEEANETNETVETGGEFIDVDEYLNVTENATGENGTVEENETGGFIDVDDYLTIAGNLTEKEKNETISNETSEKEEKTNITLRILDSSGRAFNPRIILYGEKQNFEFTSLQETEVARGTYNLVMIFSEDSEKQKAVQTIPIYNLTLRGLDLAQTFNTTIRIERLSSVPSLPGKRMAQAYAIDPTEVNFTSGEFTVRARGKVLFKCAEWSFDEHVCNGEWAEVMNLTPGELYTISFNSSDPAYAEYDVDYGAPRCSNYSSPCIANSSLLMSRDSLATPEPNQPNTVDSCTDGTSGTYMTDESVENITIEDLNGGSFNAGDWVRVTAWVYCRDATSDNINFVYSNTSASPVWRVVNYTYPCPGPGFVEVSTVFQLDNVSGNHAVRVINQYLGTGTATCGTGAYDDNDDVVFPVNGTAPSPLYGQDGIIAYRSNTGTNTLNSPKIRFWNASANNGNGGWGSEIELPSAGSPVRWAVVKWARALYKIAVITLSDDGYLDAYVCNNDCTNVGNWHVTNNIGRVWTTAPATSSRRFDFEFESNTGDLIVVYGVNSAVTTQDLAYKVLPANRTTFTGISEQYIDDTGHGTDIQYTWIRMDRKPLDSSEELIVVGFDTTDSDINAWVWNGSAWGNQIEISNAATVTGGYEALAVRYAADGSKGMAIGGDGTVGNVNTRYWNGTGWSATITFDITTANQDVRWANLKADPASDDLQGVFVDSGSRLGTAYWNGSAWTTTRAIDTGLDTSTTRCADFAWDVKGDQGYLVWDTDGAGTTLSYRVCTPQCTGTTQTTSTYAGTGAWITMFTPPITMLSNTNVRTLNARLNSNSNIGSFVENTSTPTFYNYGDSAITADTTVSTYEAYSIAFNITDSIPPSINFTPPTPANDSTVSVDWVFINTSITDNIKVYTAILEWNGTNETMNYTNSTNWYKNKTGLAQGSYTYRVWARDLAGNWNVSETRTVVYGTPPVVIVVAPHGEEYDQHSLVSLSINASDPDGINSSIAEVTLPNGTKENLTLGTGLDSDNFDSNTMNTKWFAENSSIGPGQTCVADIDTTLPDRAFISLSGDGSPQTDTLCSIISKKAIDGDFDINISFEILGSLQPDTAFNFQITEEPTSANTTKMIFIALSNWTGFGQLYEIYASDGTFSGYILSRETNDTHGKMRIKRIGNNFTFYTWNNSANDWVEENVSQNEFNFSRAVFVTFEGESVFPGWGEINVSLDNFSVWSNNFTFGLFNNTNAIGLYNVTFYVKDNIGAMNNSERTNFTITQINDPPSTPFILTPTVDSKIWGTYNITWSKVYDEEGDNVWFNITLLNPDYSYNSTLITNYGNITTTHYEWDTTAHADGVYSLRVVVFENETPEHLSNEYTLPGTFEINNTPPTPPLVVILEPLGGEYPDNKPVSIAANITDPEGTGINTTYATVTYPNGTTENITLYKCQGGDNFESSLSLLNWWNENITIGPGQTCVANVNGTIPGKAYTSISGDGSPLSDTYCSLVSRRAIYGDFDMNISFEILNESGVDYAVNFQLAEISSSANASYYVFISLSNWTGLGRNYEIFADDGTVSDYIARRETSDTFGKMRIKRVGNNFTFYTWNNTAGEWIEENSTILNLSTSLFVIMESESAYPGWGSINASWDNLSIAHDNNTYFSVFDGNVHPLGLYNVSFYATTNKGGVNDTERSNFTVININNPPSKPFILTPYPGEIAYGTYNITWSNVVDPDDDSLQFNITLLNPDGSDNATIVSDYGNSSSNQYPWDTTPYPNGEYSMRVTVFENETPEQLSNSYTLSGVFYLDQEAPAVFIIAPHGEEYPQFGPVSISINASDPDGIDYSIAEITHPNGTVENLTLGKGQQSDDFSVDSLGINWTDEESIGPLQNCILDIDTTIPGKAFTGISGDGTPESDTLCSLISKKAIDGDFDIQIDFNIEGYEGTDIALNFQITEIPSSSEVSKMAFISLSNWTGLGRNYEVFVDDGNISEYIATRETSDTFGKMRIKRVGNNFTFYTWNNTAGEWIEENSTILNLSTSLFVIMESESAYPGWGSINVSWDNFVVNDSNNTFGMFENTDLLGLYNVTIFVSDIYGRVNNTEKTNFTIVHHNYAPSKPYLLTPFPGEIASGTYHITWSSVFDLNNDTLQFNITLLNPDLTYNATIVSDYGNSSSNQYLWDTTAYPDGEYSMEILVFENETPEGLSNSYTMTGNFSVDNTPPSIQFEPPTEISGSIISRNYILVNVSAYDPHLNVIAIRLYNSSGGLLNETFSPTSPFFVNFTGLEDGLYYFNATAIDNGVNENSTETRNVTIYTTGCVGQTTTFTCGQTITESCTMTTNLSSNGTCFTINQSNIAVNCSSFSIRGNTSGYGIYVENASNFSLVDCVIGNFSSSVYAMNTNNSLFQNNTLFNSQYGFFMDPSYNNTIIENQIFNNSQYGLYLIDSHNNTLRNNSFENNTNAGLYSINSTNNTVIFNRFRNNTVGAYFSNNLLTNFSWNNITIGADLIMLSNSSNFTISFNKLWDTDRTFIRIEDGSRYNNVFNNTANNSPRKGIYIYSSSNNIIENNTVFNCTEEGIFSYQSSGMHFKNNNVSNTSYGIYTYYVSNSNFTGNILYNNSVGLYMDYSDNDTISSLVSYRNNYNWYIYSCRNTSLIQSNLSNALYSGAEIRYSSQIVINSTNISFAANCIYLLNTSSFIDSNKIWNCTDTGIKSENLSYSILNNNSIYNTNYYAIYLSKSTRNNITSNQVSNTTYDAISLQTNSSSNQIIGNNATIYISRYAFYISNSNSNLLANNTGSSINSHAYLFEYSNNTILDNESALNSGQIGFYLLSSNNISIKNSRAYNNSLHGIQLYFSNNNTLINNSAYSNSNVGLLVYVSNNTNITNMHVYNNSNLDVLISADDFNVYNLYISNLTVDNPAGNFENYTSLYITDAYGDPTIEEAYGIKWNQQPAALPSGRISFAQKYVNITQEGGSVSIDSISWSWLDSELSGYNENRFELWKYNSSGWTMLNNTPDTVNNRLSLTNMNPLSTYGILQQGENCPVITSPGQYTQTQNYVGAPNSASPLSGYACVKIASSNVVYDCNGYNITNNGTTGDTYGIVINASASNVTVKNCPGISQYLVGIRVLSSSNNTLANVTVYNNTGSGIIISSNANNNRVLNSTVYNNSVYGIYSYISANLTIENNVVYRCNSRGIILSQVNNSIINNNTVYNITNEGIYLSQVRDSVISNNTVYNTTTGIYSSLSVYNNLTNNSAYNNSYYGFYLYSNSNNNILTNNSAYNNSYGFFLSSSSNNTLTNNNITNNTATGINITSNSGNNILTSNYICFNDKMDVYNANGTNTGNLDRCDYWNSWNESGHEGCTFRCTEVWHYFYGYVNGSLLLAPNQVDIFYSWLWNGQKGKVYAVNGDAAIQWINLTALGRNVSGSNSTNDFTELDSLLGYSYEPDNVNATYSTDGSNPKETLNMTLYKHFVPYVPQANSTTQNSIFKTGIVWDASQGGPEFSTVLNQDVAFVTEINGSATYDYEIRVPANLSTYKGTSGVVKFWLELE